MTGVASDEARATHEPSPDGLGHSVGVANATEAQAEKAIAVLKRAIDAAENGNQAGENFVVDAVNGAETVKVYRDIFAEITAKAIPYCGDGSDPKRITGYRLHTGSLHRAAGRLGFQMFDGEARMASLVERNQRLKSVLRELSEAADEINAEQDLQLTDSRRSVHHDLPDNWSAPVEIPEGMWRRLNDAIINAQGIEAAIADETGTGSAVGESPVTKGDAPNTSGLSTPLPSGSIER